MQSHWPTKSAVQFRLGLMAPKDSLLSGQIEGLSNLKTSVSTLHTHDPITGWGWWTSPLKAANFKKIRLKGKKRRRRRH